MVAGEAFGADAFARAISSARPTGHQVVIGFGRIARALRVVFVVFAHVSAGQVACVAQVGTDGAAVGIRFGEGACQSIVDGPSDVAQRV